ncbi:hypothetical protein [Desulfovibrio litoralis]|uniref:B box-type domain-containing protein n=1 Tax=Desulfovibrio litoralis DSM 11393 TaxID=1121455 RepID=A0A1M7SAG5_9BACT|nr:hypothetical protein [Desulfovibrio litoralis]SHN55480.1 hypothetical protein SAMN02745728_00677 [Desulfovibrio litoralis DSM 11393]
MKCCNHTTIDAVAACKSCGRGLCSECADVYDIPTCPKCFAKQKEQELCECKDNISNTCQDMKYGSMRALLSIVWHGIFLSWGLLILFNALYHGKVVNGDVIGNIMMAWGFGGLPWAFSTILKRDDSIEAQVRRATETAGEGCVGLVFKLFFGIVIGAVASPILFIYNIYKYSTCKKKTLEAKVQLDNMS